MKCQITDFVEDRLCGYLWLFVSVLGKPACSLQAGTHWNYISYNCMLNYAIRWHLLSDSLACNISTTGNFYTIIPLFPRVLCVVSCVRRTDRPLNADRQMIIIIIVVISIVRYLIDKNEHTALYKISQTYKYAHKPKIYIYINITFLARAGAQRERIATVIWEGGGGVRKERRQNLKLVVAVLYVVFNAALKAWEDWMWRMSEGREFHCFGAQ